MCVVIIIVEIVYFGAVCFLNLSTKGAAKVESSPKAIQVSFKVLLSMLVGGFAFFSCGHKQKTRYYCS